MDQVVHFEIPVDDRERAKSFYSSVFEWNMMDSDMGGGQVYTTAQTTSIDDNMRPTEAGAINGGLMDRNPGMGAPIITLGVSSIDDSLKKVEASGWAARSRPDGDPEHGRLRLRQGPRGQRDGPLESLGLSRVPIPTARPR
jgi:predicted enzyme related to lactoylglutathione lyase